MPAVERGLDAVLAILHQGVGVAYPAAALSCGRGRVELAASVGSAAATTWFDLASLTKALCTSVLTMRLHAAGKLALDEVVQLGEGPPVRLWQLLAHCSGLPPGPPPLWAAQQGLLTAPSEVGRRAVVEMATVAPREPAAHRSVYSDLGYIVLGELLERRAEARLDEQFRPLAEALGAELAFRPLDQVAPSGNQKAPSGNQKAPSTNQKAPSTNQEAPSTNQEAPSAKRVAPSTDQEAPSTKQEAPSGKRVAPSTDQEAPSTKQEAPSGKRVAPSTDQEAPSTKQEAPSTNQKAPSTKQEAPSANQWAPSAHQLALPLGTACCAPTRRESPERELLLGQVHDDNARAMLGVAGHAGLFGTAAGVHCLAAALLDAYWDAGTPAQRALGLQSATVRHFFAAVSCPGLRTTWGLGWDHPEPLPAGSSAGSLWPRTGVGHLGFTGCSLWLDLQARGVAVLLSNRVCVSTAASAVATKERLRALRPALHDAIQRAWRDG